MPPNDAIPCVYVVRHGQTVLNAEGKFRGNVDPALDATGIKQAHKLADLFSNINICAVFSSDKQRATKTADVIAQKCGVPIHVVVCLRALDVGKLSGQPRSKENIKTLQAYLDSPDCPIPGGESLNQFRGRVGPCIQSAIHLFNETGVPPVIVAHSSIVREVGQLIMGSHKKVLVEPGGAVAIYYQNGKLEAKPIFRPMVEKKKADTIS
jgi:broad specificity phosphatase PhoE